MRPERELVRRLTQRHPGSSQFVHLGIGDDAALLRASNRELAVTKDLLIEGIHFRTGWTSPEELGWKAIAVNLSDLAAMGATAVGVLLGMALPASADEQWLDGLLSGAEECLNVHNCSLIGGDTCASQGGMVLSVTAIGRCEGPPLLRSGAIAGDVVMLSRPVGASGLGLLMLEQGEAASRIPNPVLEAHLRPQPECALGAWLSGRATACIDVSDGLVQDLGHIAEASGVRIVIDSLAVHEAVQSFFDTPREALAHAAASGEEYCLAFTVPHGSDLGSQWLGLTGRELLPVGLVSEGDGVVLMDGDEAITLPVGGYDHFQERL